MFRKLSIFILIIISLATFSNAIERSADEIKIGIFLEDIDEFGKFYKINNVPKGMFPETTNTFHLKQIRSQKNSLIHL